MKKHNDIKILTTVLFYRDNTLCYTTKKTFKLKKLAKEPKALYKWASLGYTRASQIHRGPIPKLTGPKGSSANVPVPDSTGHHQRSGVHAMTGESCFGSPALGDVRWEWLIGMYLNSTSSWMIALIKREPADLWAGSELHFGTFCLSNTKQAATPFDLRLSWQDTLTSCCPLCWTSWSYE